MSGSRDQSGCRGRRSHRRGPHQLHNQSPGEDPLLQTLQSGSQSASQSDSLMESLSELDLEFRTES